MVNKLSSLIVGLSIGVLFLTGCATDIDISGEGAKELMNVIKGVGNEVKETKKGFDEYQKRLDTLEKEQDLLEKNVSARVYSANVANELNPDTSKGAPYVVKRELGSIVDELPQPENKEELAASIRAAVVRANSDNPDDKKALDEKYAGIDKQMQILFEAVAVARAEAEISEEELKARFGKTLEEIKTAEDVAQYMRFLAVERAEKAKAERIEKAASMRRWISTIFLGLGGILFVAGVVLTLALKRNFIFLGTAAGASAGMFGYFISVLEEELTNPWFRYGMIFVGFAFLAGALFYIYKRMKPIVKQNEMDGKVANRVVGALQDARNADAASGGNTFGGIKENLKEWMVVKEKDSPQYGQPDLELKQFIRQKAEDMDLVNPGESASKL